MHLLMVMRAGLARFRTEQKGEKRQEKTYFEKSIEEAVLALGMFQEPLFHLSDRALICLLLLKLHNSHQTTHITVSEVCVCACVDITSLCQRPSFVL